MTRLFRLTALIVLIGILTDCAPAPTPVPTPVECEGQRIVVAEIADDITQVRESEQPFADYLAGRLKSFGIECGWVEVPRTTQQLAELMQAGKVDVYWDSLYPAALVSDKTGAQPVLRRWRNCDPEYYSVLLARNDSGITSIQDLPGHIIGMDNPESTSGFALASAYLRDQGIRLSVKEDFNAAVAPDEVGIVFTYADENTLTALNQGAVEAAVTDDYYFNIRLAPESHKALTVLWQSDPVVRQVVLLSPDLPADLQAAIKKELMAAELSPEGKAAMDRAAATCKFDELPEGTQAVLSQMRGIFTNVSTIPGLP